MKREIIMLKRTTLFYFNLTNFIVCLTITIIAFCQINPLCSQSFGTIYGKLVSEITRDKLSGVQIILCAISRTDREYCTLQTEPTAITDENGRFFITKVPIGEYFLMYGFPEELTTNPNDWENVRVGPLSVSLTDKGNGDCAMDQIFWSEGFRSMGEMWSCDTHQKLANGFVVSNTYGISVMVEDSKIAPYVSVVPDEEIEIQWIVQNR